MKNTYVSLDVAMCIVKLCDLAMFLATILIVHSLLFDLYYLVDLLDLPDLVDLVDLLDQTDLPVLVDIHTQNDMNKQVISTDNNHLSYI